MGAKAYAAEMLASARSIFCETNIVAVVWLIATLFIAVLNHFKIMSFRTSMFALCLQSSRTKLKLYHRKNSACKLQQTEISAFIKPSPACCFSGLEHHSSTGLVRIERNVNGETGVMYICLLPFLSDILIFGHKSSV